MKFISIFDVIGPNMIGPSSSHTAGAAAIGKLSRSLFKGNLKKVTLTLYGSFSATYKGHGTDKALLGGVLGFEPDDIRIRDSFAIAKEQGIAYEFKVDRITNPTHPNTVQIEFEGKDGKKLTTKGVSVGGGRIKIVEINGIEVDFTGEYSTLIISQTDKCGVAAHITSCLRDANVNIAFLRIFREKKGQNAFTIVESDDQIPDQIVKEIEKHDQIHGVMLVQM